MKNEPINIHIKTDEPERLLLEILKIIFGGKDEQG